MSAIGTKRTWASAPHMSAFEGKADVSALLRRSIMKSNPDLDFSFKDQGKDLELCRNITCSSPRFHSPPPFPAPRRRFGERYCTANVRFQW